MTKDECKNIIIKEIEKIEDENLLQTIMFFVIQNEQ